MKKDKPEILVVVSDLASPYKINEIPFQFKELLEASQTIDYLVCLGNVGNKENYEFLKGLSKNFYCIKGDYEENHDSYNIELTEFKSIRIGGFKISFIHGHQIVPWGDLNSLSIKQKIFDCDVLLHGFTGKSSFFTYEGSHYINPGSFTGAYSPINPNSSPSFMVLLIDNELGTVYKYELGKKVEISKFEFKKLPKETLQEENIDEDE